MFVWVTPAWAYIDPATTTYIIQVAAAIVITLGVSLSIFLYRFQIIITNIRVSLHALSRRLGKKRGVSAAAAAAATTTTTTTTAAATTTAPAALPQDDGAGSRGIQDTKGAERTRKLRAARELEAGVARLFAAQQEALASGVIDYPIPVCENYLALAETVVLDEAVRENNELAVTGSPKKRSTIDRLKAFGKWLWGDERTFKQRLLVSALIAAGLSMTYMLFPMLDSVITNITELPFALGDVIVPILFLGLAAFIILTLFLVAFRGFLFDLATCVALSFLICGYLQITFLNSNIGPLVGTPLEWKDLGLPSLLFNSLTWFIVFTLVVAFGLLRKVRARRYFKRFSLFTSSLIIAIQLVALFSILPSTINDKTFEDTGDGYVSRDLFLTRKGINEVSANKNVLVFIVDAFDQEFLNRILESDPGFFNNLDGFTFFPNNISIWNSTYPSVINYLTGVPFIPGTPYAVYPKSAYEQGTFITDIRSQGYSSNVYMEHTYCYSDGAHLSEVADNLQTVTYTLNMTTVVKQLIKLNLLKVSPHALKRLFWIYPNQFNYAIEETGPQESWIYQSDDWRFYEEISEDLKVLDSPGHFSYYHLNGSHGPYLMDAQAQYVEDGTSVLEQTKGCFYLMNEFFKQMKDLGIYKDATIIITGDHPAHEMFTLLDTARPVGLFVKPSGSEGTSLQVNNAPVSIGNLAATCVQAAGGDTTRWGRTYFEVGENEEVIRYYNHRFTDTRSNYFTAVYRVIGDARDWNNWELISVTPQKGYYF